MTDREACRERESQRERQGETETDIQRQLASETNPWKDLVYDK